MTSLAEVSRLALTLYRDPDLRPILCDMLAECHPPLQWSDFLELGTLERLAELMTIQGPGSHRVPGTLEYWLEHVGLPVTRLIVLPDGYQRLASAFGVPAVMIETGTPAPMRPDLTPLERLQARAGRRYLSDLGADAPAEATVWSAPSTGLALATLREAIAVEADTNEHAFHALVASDRLHSVLLRRAVRQHHPQATAYRLRLADSPWITRNL